eukprot:364386-Rhodomonas_salina.1
MVRCGQQRCHNVTRLNLCEYYKRVPGYPGYQVSKSLRVGIFAAPMARGEKEEVTVKEGRLTVIIKSGSVTVVSVHDL